MYAGNDDSDGISNEDGDGDCDGAGIDVGVGIGDGDGIVVLTIQGKSFCCCLLFPAAMIMITLGW